MNHFRLRAGLANDRLRNAFSLFFSACLAGVLLTASFYLEGSGTYPRLFLASLVGLVLSSAMWMIPLHVTIGDDGLYLERLGRRRRVPFGSIRALGAVAEEPNTVVVELDSGEHIPLRVSAITPSKTSNQLEGALAIRHEVPPEMPETELLRSALRSALDAFRKREAHADAAALLARSGRPTREWIRELAKPRAESAYRGGLTSTEVLLRIVDDPGADPTARAGAVLAMRGKLDDEGKARVRVAAEASASPRVRVAIEAALNEDEEAVAAAIDEVDKDERGKV